MKEKKNGSLSAIGTSVVNWLCLPSNLPSSLAGFVQMKYATTPPWYSLCPALASNRLVYHYQTSQNNKHIYSIFFPFPVVSDLWYRFTLSADGGVWLFIRGLIGYQCSIWKTLQQETHHKVPQFCLTQVWNQQHTSVIVVHFPFIRTLGLSFSPTVLVTWIVKVIQVVHVGSVCCNNRL